MVVKKPVVKKKRKVRKGTTTKTQTNKGKGGNVSQVVNVYVSKANRRRATAPKQFTGAIQPQMYNAGQDNMILGLRQQNKTLMDIFNKQSKTDTTPNSDIASLDNLIKVKKKIKIDDMNVVGMEDLNDFYDLNKKKNVVIDTTSRQNVSNMLSSIAEGMDEIPQSNEIKNRILAIGDQVRPLPQGLTSVKERVATIDDLDEIYKLELEYDELVKELQEQKQVDNSIKMSNYTSRLPKKVSKLKEKIADMKNKLATSRRMVESATPI